MIQPECETLYPKWFRTEAAVVGFVQRFNLSGNAPPRKLHYDTSKCIKGEDMLMKLVLSGLAILLAWTVFDILMHRLILRPLYERDTGLWRSFDQLNVVLIYLVTFTLIAIFVLTYWLLIRPKSLVAGVSFGALLGLALGMSAGFRHLYSHAHTTGASLELAHGWMAERHRRRIDPRSTDPRVLKGTGNIGCATQIVGKLGVSVSRSRIAGRLLPAAIQAAAQASAELADEDGLEQLRAG